MDYGMLLELQQEYSDQEKDMYMSEIADVQAAFDELVATGVELRDEPENALFLDQLEELLDHVTPMEKYLYEWIKDNFGDSEAREPSYSTKALAEHLNKIPIILGADNGKIGDLLT